MPGHLSNLGSLSLLKIASSWNLLLTMRLSARQGSLSVMPFSATTVKKCQNNRAGLPADPMPWQDQGPRAEAGHGQLLMLSMTGSQDPADNYMGKLIVLFEKCG